MSVWAFLSGGTKWLRMVDFGGYRAEPSVFRGVAIFSGFQGLIGATKWLYIRDGTRWLGTHTLGHHQRVYSSKREHLLICHSRSGPPRGTAGLQFWIW